MAISGVPTFQPAVDSHLRARIDELCTEGWALWEQFDTTVRRKEFHPFVAANYESVVNALIAHRGSNRRFLEWGSAMGVITIVADLLGYDAYGIELDGALVDTARKFAARYESRATFVHGSFIPTGYQWEALDGDQRTGTLGAGLSGYIQLGRALEDFDVIFGYPWDGEAPMMLDLMRRWGSPDAILLIHGIDETVNAYRGGRTLVASYHR
jgi:hypothetical protein